MNTKDLVFGNVGNGPYDWFWEDGSGFICHVEDGHSDFQGKDLPFRITSMQDNLSATMSLYEVLNGFLYAREERTLQRGVATDAWGDPVATQTYRGDAKYLPAVINPGDIGDLNSAGRWQWQDRQGREQAGDWKYTIHYSFLLGRLTVEEVYAERTDGGSPNDWTRFDRLEVFDDGNLASGLGFVGFRDLLITGRNAVACLGNWVHQE